MITTRMPRASGGVLPSFVIATLRASTLAPEETGPVDGLDRVGDAVLRPVVKTHCRIERARSDRVPVPCAVGEQHAGETSFQQVEVERRGVSGRLAHGRFVSRSQRQKS